MLRKSNCCSQADTYLHRAAHHERRGCLVHRMNVDQQINCVQERAQLPCPLKVRTVACAAQHGVAPDTVHVFFNIASRVRIGGVESQVSGNIRKAEAEPSLYRTQAGGKQGVYCDGTAHFVSVNKCHRHYEGSGHATIECMDVVD